MIARSLLLCCSLCGLLARGQTQRWMWLSDGVGGPDLLTGVAICPDTTYRTAVMWTESGIGHIRSTGISKEGAALWSHESVNPDGAFEAGISHTTARRVDGTWLCAAGVYPGGTSDPDGVLYCFTDAGDTLWYKRFITLAYDGFNAMCQTPDGGACLAGLSNLGNNQFYVVRVAADGDSLWAKSLGSAQSESAYSISLTADNGFLVSGYKLQSGNQYDMHVMRLNEDGDLLWQRSHGSPWSDNAGFACELSDGRILLAGGERPSANGNKRPALYMLNDQGFEIWSEVYLDATQFGAFYAVPILMENGDFVISGSENVVGTPRGMLVRTDSVGEVIWKRLYQTNETVDSYTYDSRRTLDGGFILSGTAFDSALVSQDAWLVKVDSFGCLVPGCQVFDGLQEQVTDLRDALEVFPNPASEQATVRITLPEGLKSKNLRLALVSAEGKLVQEEMIAATTPTHLLNLARCAPGLYFVHLLDGTRWLSGTKLMVE